MITLIYTQLLSTYLHSILNPHYGIMPTLILITKI